METEDNSTSYTMDETDELYRWAFFKFIEVKFFSSQKNKFVIFVSILENVLIIKPNFSNVSKLIKFYFQAYSELGSNRR